MSIQVDKEFKELIPPLSSDEYSLLEENILREGIRDPLVIWSTPSGDILIDGHNRWEISAKHAGIRFEVVKKEFPDRESVKEWIIKNQLGRRNIPAYVRAELALKLKPMLEKQAQERQYLGLKSDEGSRTDVELGKRAGVGKDTIRKVEKIQEKASPEAKEALRRGEASINQVYTSIIASEHEDKRQKEARELREAKKRTEAFEEKKSEGIVDFEDIKQNREDQELIAEDFIEDFDKMVQHLRRFSNQANDGRFEKGLRCADKYELRAIMTHLQECYRTILKLQRITQEVLEES